MKNSSAIGVIPARYKSSRFPGKPLAQIHGRPMIEFVYRQAQKAKSLTEVVVATDDERIAQAVKEFGGKAVMTSSRHSTGTDRVAQAAGRLKGEFFVNIQGDEPLVAPEMIEQAIRPLLADSSVWVSTLMSPLDQIEEMLDVNVVKTAVDLAGNILYFSRLPIPYPKERQPFQRLKQIGLYAFRREALENFSKWKPSPLESLEGVEFFRFLEHGIKVRGVLTRFKTVAVDTPADLERVRRLIRRADSPRH